MMLPIIILSFVFIALAFILSEENAKYLLAGYNTMKDEDRKKIDIRAYILFFKKFHLFLGASVFLLGTISFYFFNPGLSGLFLGLYPVTAYIHFIRHGRKYKKED